MRSQLCILVFIFFCAFSGVSQVKEWKSVTFEDGLTDLQSFDVFSDSDGYIWIGNRTGVNRYDGKDIEIYNRSNGLMSDNVFSFFEDSQGRIWVNNLTGEPVFIKDGVVHNRITDPYLERLKTEKFKISIFEDRDGRICFLAHGARIFTLSNSEVNVHKYRSKNNPRDADVGLFEQDGELILICQKGIKVFDYNFNLLRESSWSVSLFSKRSFLMEDRIYVASDNFLHIFDINTLEQIERISFDKPTLVTDLREINGKLHLSTSFGIYTLNGDTITNKGYEDFADVFVSAVEKGVDGRLWVATREKGVLYESLSLVGESSFSDFKDISYLKKISKDSIYIGFDTKKMSLLANGSITPISLDREETFKVLKTLRVDGKLWVVTSTFLFNIDDGYALNFYKRDGIYSKKYDKFYFPFHSGVKYIDNSNGFSNLEYRDDGVVKHSKILKRIVFNQGYKCVNGPDDLIWVGTGDGLCYVKDTVLSKVEVEGIEGSVIDLKLSGKDLIGINYGVGLFLYDPLTNVNKVMSTKNGLPSMNLTKLCVEGDDIWLTHGLGISHVKKSNGELKLIRNYGYEHGIPVGDITFIKSLDGILHFVVDKNVYKLSEDVLYSDSLNVILNEEPIDAFVNDAIDVGFNCVNYSFGKDVSYQYRLLPNDRAWKNTTDELITFQYLPPNDYILEVKASHPLNLKSRVARKSLDISARWYKTYWFFLILLLFLATMIWWMLRVGVLDFDSKLMKSFLRKLIKDKKESPLILKDIQGVTKLVRFKDVVYIKASGNYVEYITVDEEITVRATMKKTEKLVDKNPYLVRVHRSYIANLKRLKGISQNKIELDEYSIPYSATYKDKLDDYVGYVTS